MTKEDLIARNRGDLRAVMSLVSGRRFIYQVFNVCGLWRSSFRKDRNSTDFNEGSRAVALALWKDIKTNCPEDLIKLLMENDNDEPIQETASDD